MSKNLFDEMIFKPIRKFFDWFAMVFVRRQATTRKKNIHPKIDQTQSFKHKEERKIYNEINFKTDKKKNISLPNEQDFEFSTKRKKQFDSTIQFASNHHNGGYNTQNKAKKNCMLCLSKLDKANKIIKCKKCQTAYHLKCVIDLKPSQCPACRDIWGKSFYNQINKN